MEIFWRANGQDPVAAETVTGIERESARAFMLRALRLWETVFLNIQLGTLGEEAMDQMGNWRRICEWPLLKRDWEYFQYYLGENFGQYVADTCALEWTGPVGSSS